MVIMKIEKLKNTGKNTCEVHYSGGKIQLVSYETPVAEIVEGKGFVLKKFFSRTTSKHVTQFFANYGVLNVKEVESL